jgi:hypothetical protein
LTLIIYKESKGIEKIKPGKGNIMPKIKYLDINFRGRSLQIIEKANEIIAEYQAEGLELTLRQIYYQFVSRDIIPNKDSEYKKLGSIINDARLAGLIDWLAIVDRTRNLQKNSHWETASDILDSAESSFAVDKWQGQETRCEVWIEKDALVGVIERPCRELDVPFFSCRGYTSQSEMWVAARRMMGYFNDEECKRVVVFHFGDHDPSGIDMTRDIQDRLNMLAEDGCQDEPHLEVKRIALTMEQVRKYNPPPNPAKITDSRSQGYIREHGHESWELDALEPRVLTELVKKNVKSVLDMEAWLHWEAKEDKEKSFIHAVAAKHRREHK